MTIRGVDAMLEVLTVVAQVSLGHSFEQSQKIHLNLNKLGSISMLVTLLLPF